MIKESIEIGKIQDNEIKKEIDEVGKPGKEGVYNIQIMEEKQTILAAGAGASTKTVDPATDRIERVFNVKSIEDYIGRIDEMIERKRQGLPQGGKL